MVPFFELLKRNRIPAFIALVVLSILILRHSTLLGTIYLNLGLVNLNRLKMSQGLETTAAAELQLSEHFLTNAAGYQPTNQAALWGLGKLFLVQGDKKKVQAIWKNNVIPVDTILLSGLYKEQERRWEEALIWYEIAAEFDLSKAAIPLGRLLNQENRYAKAIPVWQTALEDHPDHPSRRKGLNGLIDSFEGSQQWEQVLLTSGEALSEFAGDTILLTNLGKAQYFHLGDEKKAIRTIKRAIMIDPSFAEAYASIAAIMAREENFDAAFEWYSQAIERNPDVRSWYVSRANVARKAGDLDVAMELYLEAIIIDPDYAPP